MDPRGKSSTPMPGGSPTYLLLGLRLLHIISTHFDAGHEQGPGEIRHPQSQEAAELLCSCGVGWGSRVTMRAGPGGDTTQPRGADTGVPEAYFLPPEVASTWGLGQPTRTLSGKNPALERMVLREMRRRERHGTWNGHTHS